MDEGVLVKKKSTTRLRVVSFQFDVAGLIRGIFYSIHGVESSKNSHIQYITYFTMYSPLQWLSLCRHHKSLATLWTRLKYMEGEIKVRRIGERAAPHGVALCRIGWCHHFFTVTSPICSLYVCMGWWSPSDLTLSPWMTMSRCVEIFFQFSRRVVIFEIMHSSNCAHMLKTMIKVQLL